MLAPALKPAPVLPRPAGPEAWLEGFCHHFVGGRCHFVQCCSPCFLVAGSTQIPKYLCAAQAQGMLIVGDVCMKE